MNRQEVKELAVWKLNTLRTVEMTVDFRRNPPALPTPHHEQIPGNHHLSGPEGGQSHWLYCEKGPAEAVFPPPAKEVQPATGAAETALLCHHRDCSVFIYNCLVWFSYPTQEQFLPPGHIPPEQHNTPQYCASVHNSSNLHLKSSFPKRYKSILIVFMKMTFFYLDPYILLIFNLSC